MDKRIREGLIPAVLGTAVTAAGLAAYAAYPVTGAGIAGFGLAHIVLGGIDLVTHDTDDTTGGGSDTDTTGTNGTI